MCELEADAVVALNHLAAALHHYHNAGFTLVTIKGLYTTRTHTSELHVKTNFQKMKHLTIKFLNHDYQLPLKHNCVTS